MGGVGNRAAEEDWRWDLNPGMAAVKSLEPRGFGAHFAKQVRKLESKM